MKIKYTDHQFILDNKVQEFEYTIDNIEYLSDLLPWINDPQAEIPFNDAHLPLVLASIEKKANIKREWDSDSPKLKSLQTKLFLLAGIHDNDLKIKAMKAWFPVLEPLEAPTRQENDSMPSDTQCYFEDFLNSLSSDKFDEALQFLKPIFLTPNFISELYSVRFGNARKLRGDNKKLSAQELDKREKAEATAKFKIDHYQKFFNSQLSEVCADPGVMSQYLKACRILYYPELLAALNPTLAKIDSPETINLALNRIDNYWENTRKYSLLRHFIATSVSAEQRRARLELIKAAIEAGERYDGTWYSYDGGLNSGKLNFRLQVYNQLIIDPEFKPFFPTEEEKEELDSFRRARAEANNRLLDQVFTLEWKINGCTKVWHFENIIEAFKEEPGEYAQILTKKIRQTPWFFENSDGMEFLIFNLLKERIDEETFAGAIKEHNANMKLEQFSKAMSVLSFSILPPPLKFHDHYSVALRRLQAKGVKQKDVKILALCRAYLLKTQRIEDYLVRDAEISKELEEACVANRDEILIGIRAQFCSSLDHVVAFNQAFPQHKKQLLQALGPKLITFIKNTADLKKLANSLDEADKQQFLLTQYANQTNKLQWTIDWCKDNEGKDTQALVTLLGDDKLKEVFKAQQDINQFDKAMCEATVDSEPMYQAVKKVYHFEENKNKFNQLKNDYVAQRSWYVALYLARESWPNLYAFVKLFQNLRFAKIEALFQTSQQFVKAESEPTQQISIFTSETMLTSLKENVDQNVRAIKYPTLLLSGAHQPQIEEDGIFAQSYKVATKPKPNP